MTNEQAERAEFEALWAIAASGHEKSWSDSAWELFQASRAPLLAEVERLRNEATESAREWFLFLNKIAPSMALPFDGEAPTMDELGDIINTRFNSFLVSPAEIAKLRADLEIARSAMTSVRQILNGAALPHKSQVQQISETLYAALSKLAGGA